MNRNQELRPIELGAVSVETKGQVAGTPPDDLNLARPNGLSDD